MKAAADIQNPEVQELARRAEAFVVGHAWCEHVVACSLAFAVAGVVGIFRIDLVPARPNVDAAVWAVVGDLPPAYVALEEGDSWQDALREYVAEMELWVAAARTGESVADLIPVNLSPTPEHAEMLKSRLGFLRERLADADPTTLQSDV